MSESPATRHARAEDEAAVMRLLAQLFGSRTVAWDGCRRAFRALLDGERGAILVADEDGTIAGVITVSFNLAIRYGGDYAQIEELVIDDTRRGTGLGARLLHDAVALATARGCPEIGLYARPENVPFYERHGFVQAGPELRRRLD